MVKIKTVVIILKILANFIVHQSFGKKKKNSMLLDASLNKIWHNIEQWHFSKKSALLKKIYCIELV